MKKKISSKGFFEFVNLVSARELEYFIFESSYTTKFNNGIKDIVEDLKKQGKINIEFMILFNTKGEIALINEEIIGGYVGENLIQDLKQNYNIENINELIDDMEKKSYEEKQEFIEIIYRSLCRILNEIYKEVKYRKEIEESYRKRYIIEKINGQELPIAIVSILIVEDICAYLSFDVELTRTIPQKTK